MTTAEQRSIFADRLLALDRIEAERLLRQVARSAAGQQWGSSL